MPPIQGLSAYNFFVCINLASDISEVSRVFVQKAGYSRRKLDFEFIMIQFRFIVTYYS